jgi:hypothetical protein
MKKIILMALFCCAFSLAKAQFANTKWNGMLMVPEQISVILDFKKDTLIISSDESGEVLETMSYSIKADTLVLKKVSGGSPCPEGSFGKVKFNMANNKLSILSVVDSCQMRAAAWTKEPFTKIKE